MLRWSQKDSCGQERGDIIAFYNKIYRPAMEQFLLQQASNPGGAASAAAPVPPPSSMGHLAKSIYNSPMTHKPAPKRGSLHADVPLSPLAQPAHGTPRANAFNPCRDSAGRKRPRLDFNQRKGGSELDKSRAAILGRVTDAHGGDDAESEDEDGGKDKTPLDQYWATDR